VAKRNDGPVAILTGASSGIGRATALLLAREGWRVALGARRVGPLEAVRHEATVAAGKAGRAVASPTNVAQPAQVRMLVDAAMAKFGRIDALVNNAGFAPNLPIDRTDQSTIQKTFEINAIGPAIAIHCVWPIMAEQGGGRIVNISTLGSVDPFPGFFAYASSKAAVNVMALSCALEGKGDHIRAFAIAPGAVETPLLRELYDEQTIPPEACLSPEEVAQVIYECIDGQRDQDNGRTIFLQREGAEMVQRVGQRDHEPAGR